MGSRATTQTSRELLYGLGFPACLRARIVLSRRFVFSLFVWPRAIFNIMNPCASGLYKYERMILNITHGRDVSKNKNKIKKKREGRGDVKKERNA